MEATPKINNLAGKAAERDCSSAEYDACRDGAHDQSHIAVLGTRGIPAAYGGFETFAEELSARLVQRGYRVTVYGRRFLGERCKGAEMVGEVQLRRSWSVRQKYLETPLAALTSFMDVIVRDVDAVILCNAANSPFAWILKLAGIPLAINVDGIERERKKWSGIGKLWYRLGERASVLFADRVIADAEVIRTYYLEKFRAHTELIAYGATPRPLPAGATLARFGLTAGNYLLYVSRLEPENNALGVVEAFRSVATELPLVIVGDAPYAREYIARVRGAADPRVVFTGFQFGDAYRELRTHCRLYIQATEVGGTHPALVEAMAYGNCVVANDVPEHREVLREAGRYYPKNDFVALAELLQELVSDAEQVQSLRAAAQAEAAERYSWDRIVDQYEELLLEMIRK